MPSHLRLQSSFEPVEAPATFQTSPTFPPAKKQKMSLSQTYYVASTARSKLGREAGRADHNLRLLVGHANLLDSLMIELADAEREQEAWFNSSVRTANKSHEPQHVQWIDSIAEDLDEDDEDSDDASDDGSDLDDDAETFSIPLRKIKSPPVSITSAELDDDCDEDDDYMDAEFDEEHALTRVASKHSPPELTLDDSSDDEDDSLPPSPGNTTLELSEKERQAISSTSFYDMEVQQDLGDYVMQQPQATVIAAC